MAKTTNASPEQFLREFAHVIVEASAKIPYAGLDELIQGWAKLLKLREDAIRLDGHRTTSIVLQYVIDADSGFMGDSKAAAKHWKKKTDELTTPNNTTNSPEESEKT